MATFEEGLIIGLALRRKRKSSYFDDIYHDILNNTTYVFEQDIDDKYSFKCGVWQPAEGWGRLGLGGTYPTLGEDVEAGVDNSGNIPKSTQLYSLTSAGYLRSVTVIFREDKPLYAVVEPHGADIGAKTEYKMFSVPIDSTKTKAVFYVSRDSLTIDSISHAPPGTYASPAVSGSSSGLYTFGGYYRGIPQCSISYSYQTYNVTCETGGTPSAVPYENRTAGSTYISFDGLIFPRGAGVFADMTDDELMDTINTVSDAVCASVGYPYYSPIIIH